MVRVRSFAGGRDIGGGGWLERVNPAHVDEVVGAAEQADPAAAESAVRDAHRAFEGWRTLPLDRRCELLLAAADAVEATAGDLGPLLARELGKVVGDCRGEMGFAAACLRWCVATAPRVAAAVEVDDAAGRLRIERVPYGVVVAVVPWNAPLILSILKVAPALVCGNTIVVKPSPLAPLAVTRALRTIADALPPGALSVLHGGAEVGATLVGHDLVRKVAFTGGVPTARTVAATAGHAITPLVLELGGNDPAIVLDDAPYSDELFERMVFGTFLTSGQVCMAAKRVYVPARTFADFVDGYVAAAARVLHVGDPLDSRSTMGPMASAGQRAHVERLVGDAAAAGAEVRTVGSVVDGCDLDAGWFLRPTVVLGAPEDAAVVGEEQFGPTVPLLAYDDLDDAVARANASELALASSVWSSDVERAFDVASRLEAGTTFVNCHNRAGMSLRAPFGGMKQSGFGREFGEAGLSEYLQTHSIHLPASMRWGGPAAASAYPGT